MCTHTLRITDREFDQIVVMSDGLVVAKGSVSELLTEFSAEDITGVFLAATRQGEGLLRSRNLLRDALRPAPLSGAG